MTRKNTTPATPAPVSPRLSAQIYALPGAATVPVVNPARSRGRPPKVVTSIWRGRRIQARRAWEVEKRRIQQDIAVELMLAAFASGKGLNHD